MKASFLLVSALIVLSNPAIAGSTNCPTHFANGQAPELVNQKLSPKTTALCFEGFALLHSGITHTPLWTAEHLTKERVLQAKGMKRKNKFHAEDQLPAGDGAELDDYVHSGFDRGHMSPSGDMPTENAQYESFSLANMIPQNPNKNQNLWEGIESGMRDMAIERRELYIVTGPLFEGSQITRMNSRVFIPTSTFKAIYDPVRREAGAYITPNKSGMDYQTLSISELEKKLGINVFPKLTATIKDKKMALPVPTPHSSKYR